MKKGETEQKVHPSVLRGGCFNNNDNNIRVDYRNNNNPTNINNNNGFRCVQLL